jgi:hypothetical protein
MTIGPTRAKMAAFGWTTVPTLSQSFVRGFVVNMPQTCTDGDVSSHLYILAHYSPGMNRKFVSSGFCLVRGISGNPRVLQRGHREVSLAINSIC